MGRAKGTDKKRQIAEGLVAVEVIRTLGLREDGKGLCRQHLLIAVAVAE